METESEAQIKLVAWFRKTWPLVRIMSIPNGARTAISTAKRLKKEGLSKGVPDLFVPEFSLWIEMKREKGGTISAEQKDWHQYLEGFGHKIIVGKGFADAQEKITKFMAHATTRIKLHD